MRNLGRVISYAAFCHLIGRDANVEIYHDGESHVRNCCKSSMQRVSCDECLISEMRMKNMKWPAYANTGFVTLINVHVKSVVTTASDSERRTLIQAPTIPSIPAQKMEITLAM